LLILPPILQLFPLCRFEDEPNYDHLLSVLSKIVLKDQHQERHMTSEEVNFPALTRMLVGKSLTDLEMSFVFPEQRWVSWRVSDVVKSALERLVRVALTLPDRPKLQECKHSLELLTDEQSISILREITALGIHKFVCIHKAINERALLKLRIPAKLTMPVPVEDVLASVGIRILGVTVDTELRTKKMQSTILPATEESDDETDSDSDETASDSSSEGLLIPHIQSSERNIPEVRTLDGVFRFFYQC